MKKHADCVNCNWYLSSVDFLVQKYFDMKVTHGREEAEAWLVKELRFLADALVADQLKDLFGDRTSFTRLLTR